MSNFIVSLVPDSGRVAKVTAPETSTLNRVSKPWIDGHFFTWNDGEYQTDRGDEFPERISCAR
jgi:hypothetical protein